MYDYVYVYVYDYVYVGVSAQSDPKRVAFLGGHARAKADTQSGGNMQEYSCCSSWITDFKEVSSTFVQDGL